MTGVYTYQVQMYFIQWYFWILTKKFPELYSQWSNWQYVGIGWDNGLVQNRQQAINWTSDNLAYYGIIASLGPNISSRSNPNETDVKHFNPFTYVFLLLL